MSSSPSPLLKLELQASGEHPDTWGDNLNATLVLIENAIAKRAPIATTGGTTTLTDTQFADNQDRCAALDFSGVLVSNAVIVVPARTKSWIIRNQCTGVFTLTVKTPLGSGVVIAQGQVATVWCDGTNVLSASTDASSLGGIAASDYARLSAKNIFTSGNAHTFHPLADSGTITLDSAVGDVFSTTLAGNRTLAVTNATDGAEIEYYLTQDSTGGRTLTLPGNFVGSGPTLSTGANATDLLLARYNASLGVWFYRLQRGLNTGGSSTITDVTVTGNSTNVDVFALAGQPTGAVTFTFTLDTGTLLQSTATGTPALDFSGFAAGSVLNIVIKGIVHGKGGRGGNGGLAGGFSGNDPYAEPGRVAENGGDAIRLPSAACTISININDNGRVWSGGGGGGGGGGTSSTAASNIAAGGGGGGGAGGGEAGQGFRARSDTGAETASGTNGTDGTVGRLGSFGAKGIGGNFGTADGGDGGDGGDFGADGSDGESPTAQAFDAAGGGKGTAGKAINYNGGSAPTYTGHTGSPYIKGATA